MAIFKYTLPSGAKFDLDAPTGTTQTQADFIFYSQVATGGLVGYTIGQTLTSAQTRLTKFELSRLDRDTAGVDTVTILSIVTGEIALSVPALLNTPLQTPITAADYAGTPVGLGLDPVGPLGPDEVQALITTTEVYVDQPADTITDTGIGTYNITPESLEKTGYLKPGTSNYPDFACVIGTPSVWTGKDGVTSVAGILDDPGLQTRIQNGVLQLNYESLTASGTIQTQPTAPASTSTGQIFGATGLTALTAATLVSGTAALSANFNKLITSSFAGASSLGANAATTVNSLLSTPINNISTIANGAVTSVTQGIAGLSTGATAAANSLISGALGSATGAVNGAVGALVNNAAQFTAPVAAAWAQGSALLNSTLGSAQGVLNSTLGQAQGLLTGAIGGAQGLLTDALGQAQGYATNALGSLSGLATGALGSLGTQAQALLGNLGGSLDIFGKMSSFSVDFSLFSSDSLVSATKVAAGFSNTVNRQTVDAAVTRILGNPKIPTPSFEFPSSLTAGINADIALAQTKLKELGGQVSTGFTNLTSGLSSTGINGPV
jgi:hypothetical protein